MVYKIEGEFNDNAFSRILIKIAKEFVFIYSDGIIYVAQISYKNKDDKYVFLKRSLSEVKKLKITLLDESNMHSCPQEITEWARNAYVRLEKEKYEAEEQDSLRHILKKLDDLEAELDEQVKEKYIKMDDD